MPLRPRAAARPDRAARAFPSARCKIGSRGYNVAEDQESSRLFRVALHPVGAFGVVADGLQAQPTDHFGRKMVGVALRHVPLQPARQRGGIGEFGIGDWTCFAGQLCAKTSPTEIENSGSTSPPKSTSDTLRTAISWQLRWTVMVCFSGSTIQTIAEPASSHVWTFAATSPARSVGETASTARSGDP